MGITLASGSCPPRTYSMPSTYPFMASSYRRLRWCIFNPTPHRTGPTQFQRGSCGQTGQTGVSCLRPFDMAATQLVAYPAIQAVVSSGMASHIYSTVSRRSTTKYTHLLSANSVVTRRGCNHRKQNSRPMEEGFGAIWYCCHQSFDSITK